jgi:NAD dependent epimerase/dehydratase family enzyme
MLARLLTPFEFGLGGPIGSGAQWMSWIERDDLVRLIAHAIATPSLTGAVNATAPNPVTNAEFTRELGHALHRPAFLRIPAAPLRMLARDLAEELLLGGQCVLPDKAEGSGFKFRHETLGSALAAMLDTARAQSSIEVSDSAGIPEPEMTGAGGEKAQTQHGKLPWLGFAHRA